MSSKGPWNGTLSLQGESLRLVLRMANQADGTASGTLVSVDRGDLELTLGMTQKASMLTLNSPVIGGDFFAGSLNAAGELAGTFTQGPLTVPLTFRPIASSACASGGADAIFDQQRPRVGPPQLAVVLRRPVVCEVLVALGVRPVVHRSA